MLVSSLFRGQEFDLPFEHPKVITAEFAKYSLRVASTAPPNSEVNNAEHEGMFVY
jgi:hypothetical protein